MAVTHGVDRTGTAGGGGGSAPTLLNDGTSALTGNWDAGSFEVRAQTFESDVATGTAPFTIASTTVVANLNADLFDGSHAAALLGTIDHGSLTGLADDDHTQYAFPNGSRVFTGGVTIDKTSPKLKLVRTSDSGEDSEIRFCESDGDRRFNLNHTTTSLHVGNYVDGGSYYASHVICNTDGSLQLHNGGGHVQIGGGAAVSELRFKEASGNGSNYVALKAPDSIASSFGFIFPTAQGASGQVLRDSGSGSLVWDDLAISYTGVRHSLSGAAYYDFTGIPSGVKEIYLGVLGAQTGYTWDSFYVCIGDSGGVETANYRGATLSVGGSSIAYSLSTSTYRWDITSTTMCGSGNYLYGACHISLASSGSNAWVFTGAFGTAIPGLSECVGSKELSGTLDRVRFGETYSASIASGTGVLLYR